MYEIKNKFGIEKNPTKNWFRVHTHDNHIIINTLLQTWRTPQAQTRRYAV